MSKIRKWLNSSSFLNIVVIIIGVIFLFGILGCELTSQKETFPYTEEKVESTQNETTPVEEPKKEATVNGEIDVEVTPKESEQPPKSTTEQPEEEKKEITVYITKTGECYHSAGCQYLRKSCIPINLEAAKTNGYRP